MLSFLKKLSSRPSKGENFFVKIEAITGFKVQKEAIYQLAFTHSSAGKELKNGQKLNNERLEFLGDAILGAVITDYLYRIYPNQEEGELTSLRSKLVSRKHLNELGDGMNLDQLLDFTPSRGTKAKSLKGDAFEALIGALYLDHGYEACQKFLERKVLKKLNLESLSLRLTSYKSGLLEWSQKEKKQISFQLIRTEGKSHDPIYHVACLLGKQELSQGSAATKKKAEEESAKAAFQVLNLPHGEVQTRA